MRFRSKYNMDSQNDKKLFKMFSVVWFKSPSYIKFSYDNAD